MLARGGRLLCGGDGARQGANEVLERRGRPALEGRAELLVGGYYRVAVVPVEPRLWVEPEGAPGARGDLGEDVGTRVAPVGARVAEHDHGRARVQVVLDLRQELRPNAAVVGVAGDVSYAGVAGDLLADGFEVALVFEDVGDLGDPLDEHERAHLAKRVVQRVQHRQEENRRRGHAREDIAQNVNLGAFGAAGTVLQHDRDAACLQRGAHRAPAVPLRVSAVAAVLHPLRGQPPAQLRDDSVHRSEIREWAGGQGAVELPQRSRRREAARALDLRALELAPERRLEAPQRLGWKPAAAGVPRRQLQLGLRAQAERPADALYVHADHARALLAPGERGDRHAREIAHCSLRAVAQSGGDLCAQLLEVLLGELAQRRALTLANALLDGSNLRGAEEEAVEHQLEHAAVLLALGERRRERLAEVAL